MSGESWGTIIAIIVILVVVGVILGYLLYWFYRRASQDIAFVRTGLGGTKVVADGGAVVIPLVHAMTPVNMNALRLEVARERERALITANRMRVDVAAEFYVRVAASNDAIAAAARTLGARTLDPPSLTELLEGKFVDALRRVAAEMSMDELHEQRGTYARKVREAVAADLTQNGLELEAVSLTQLDQTPIEFFNPSNAFDAEGLTRLTEQIEARRKRRNDIEQDTLIEIRNKNLATDRASLQIDRDAEYARLEQQRDLEVGRASQRAEIAREQARRNVEAEEAAIQAAQEVEQRRIASERVLQASRIERERDIERLEIERRRDLEVAEHDRAIVLAQKQVEEADAQAEASAARARAIAAQERIESARDYEVAERRKAIALLAAEEDARREGIRITLSAQAEKQAAEDRADAERSMAQGEADAERIRLTARKIRHELEAEAERLMNEAHNMLSGEARRAQLRRHLIDRMDGIIRESVKPLENIEGIRILQVDGLSGGGSGGGRGNGGASPTDEVINSALRYRAQAPMVDYLLRQIGIEEGDDVSRFADSLIQPRRSELSKLAEQARREGGGEGGDGSSGGESD